MSGGVGRFPWVAREGAGPYRYEVVDSFGSVVARVRGGLTDGGRDKAVMLAEAPELHASLRTLIDLLFSSATDVRFDNDLTAERFGAAMQRARAALKRAEAQP